MNRLVVVIFVLAIFTSTEAPAQSVTLKSDRKEEIRAADERAASIKAIATSDPVAYAWTTNSALWNVELDKAASSKKVEDLVVLIKRRDGVANSVAAAKDKADNAKTDVKKMVK